MLFDKGYFDTPIKHSIKHSDYLSLFSGSRVKEMPQDVNIKVNSSVELFFRANEQWNAIENYLEVIEILKRFLTLRRGVFYLARFRDFTHVFCTKHNQFFIYQYKMYFYLCLFSLFSTYLFSCLLNMVFFFCASFFLY